MSKIEDYSNYRELIEDYYQENKLSSPLVNYTLIAKAAGLGSPNHLKMIIDGKRNLTISNIHGIANAMNLGVEQTDYFECLVLENQAKTDLEKRYYSRRLSSLKKNLNATSYSYQTVAKTLLPEPTKIAAMVVALGQQAETAAANVASELNFSLEESKALLSSLIKMRELNLSDDGRYFRPTDQSLMLDRSRKNYDMRLLIEDGLKENLRIFDQRYSAGTARFFSLLSSAAPGSLNVVFRDLYDTILRITDKYEPLDNQPRAAYRIQLQAFRLCRNEE